MPQQSFTHTAVSDAAVDQVWMSLQVPETWETIPGVDHVIDPVFDGEDLTRFKFQSVVAGKEYVGTASAGPRAQPRLMTWDIATTDLMGSVEVELVPVDTKTQVSVTMTARSVGMLSSVFFPVIATAIGSGFADAVEEFAARFSPA